MIPANHRHMNSGSDKFRRLSDKCQPGILVRPISVIKVSSDHYQIDCLLDRQFGQIGKRATRCAPNAFTWGVFILVKLLKRTIQVDIGCMEDLACGQGNE